MLEYGLIQHQMFIINFQITLKLKVAKNNDLNKFTNKLIKTFTYFCSFKSFMNFLQVEKTTP